MKELAKVHLLPTDKASTLYQAYGTLRYGAKTIPSRDYQPFNLYITTDDEIKEGDWCLFFWDGMRDRELAQVGSEPQQYLPSKGHILNRNLRKIIATTDPELNLSEPHMSDKDAWWCGKNAVKKFITFSDAYKYWQQNKLPQIPQSFIESYCKNPVDKVMVEYETIGEWEYKISNDLEGWECKTCYDWILKNNPKCSCEVKLKLTSNNEIIIHPVKDSWTVEDLPDLLNRFCKDHSLHRGLQITDGMIREWLEKQ